jgi:hypothetical protein
MTLYEQLEKMKSLSGIKEIELYHGTDLDFDGFDITKAQAMGKFGLWFTDDKEFAGMFGGNVKTAQIHLNNPKVITATQWDNIRSKHAKDHVWFANWKEQLIAQGHDSLMIKSKTETFAGQQVRNPNIFAIFNQDSIK